MAEHKRWFKPSRTFLAVIGSIAFLLFATFAWGFQTLMCIEFRHQAAKHPILIRTPQPLVPVAPNLQQGTVLSHHGFTFEAPWGDFNPQRSKVVGNWAIFVFDSGLVITFCPPGPTNNDLKSTVQEHLGSDESLERVFGRDATKSNYAFHSALLAETPAKLRPWTSQAEVARSDVILMYKAISSVGGDTGLFKVAANGWNGFQFDDPAKAPKVTLELYGADDRHIEISIASRKDAPIHPTQADVNRILVSLRTQEAGTPDTIAPPQKIASR